MLTFFLLMMGGLAVAGRGKGLSFVDFLALVASLFQSRFRRRDETPLI